MRSAMWETRFPRVTGRSARVRTRFPTRETGFFANPLHFPSLRPDNPRLRPEGIALDPRAIAHPGRGIDREERTHR